MDSRGEKEIAATAEGGRSHLSTYPVAPTHSPPGTPTSNVVININGAAQYSPDLASPCIYLRSISLLGTERTPPPRPAAYWTLACGELTLLRFPGPSLTLRKVTYLVCLGWPKSKGCTRHFLVNVRNIEWYLCWVTSFRTLVIRPIMWLFVRGPSISEDRLERKLKEFRSSDP